MNFNDDDDDDDDDDDLGNYGMKMPWWMLPFTSAAGSPPAHGGLSLLLKGFQWSSLKHFGSKLGRCTLWNFMEPCGSLCNPMELYGTLI